MQRYVQPVAPCAALRGVAGHGPGNKPRNVPTATDGLRFVTAVPRVETWGSRHCAVWFDSAETHAFGYRSGKAVESVGADE
ncbi:hypothetical protein DICA1_C00914 [Diutina catenulata]